MKPWFGRNSKARSVAIIALLALLSGGCSNNDEAPPSGSDSSSSPQPRSTYAINSTDDLPDSLPGDGKCESPAGTCTLRAAIMEANFSLNPTATPKVFVPAGHYLLTIPPAPLSLGAIDSSSGALAPNFSIRIQGAGARQTIIDGNQLDSVFLAFNPLATLALSDLTLTGGVGRQLSGLAVTGGGGVFSQGRLELTRVIVRDNRADYGGGVFSTPSGSVVIDSSTISNNIANLEAGGIRFDATALLINSTVSGNTVLASCCESGFENYPGSQVGAGGGVDARGAGVVQIINSTIVNNHAVNGGGGINIATGYQGDQGNLLETLNLHLGGPMVITNSIIAGNSSDNGPRNCDSTIAELLSAGGNIADDDSCPHDGPRDLANTDPRLGPLADNGGSTDTHAPQNGSPATGNGVGEACPDADQRGASRARGQSCDSGAVQSRS